MIDSYLYARMYLYPSISDIVSGIAMELPEDTEDTAGNTKHRIFCYISQTRFEGKSAGPLENTLIYALG